MTDYTNKFKSADDLIISLQTVIRSVDPQTQALYAGFFAVTAITVYELAIKDIFTSFAENKHIDFGNFVTKHFDKINGQIRIRNLSEHLTKFGENYKTNFHEKLDDEYKTILREHGTDLKVAYDNIILCRHRFVHVGVTTLTLNECITAYKVGKSVITSLSRALS